MVLHWFTSLRRVKRCARFFCLLLPHRIPTLFPLSFRLSLHRQRHRPLEWPCGTIFWAVTETGPSSFAATSMLLIPSRRALRLAFRSHPLLNSTRLPTGSAVLALVPGWLGYRCLVLSTARMARRPWRVTRPAFSMIGGW